MTEKVQQSSLWRLACLALMFMRGLLPSEAFGQLTGDFGQQLISAAQTSGSINANDQIWVVSTRCIPSSCQVDGPFAVSNFNGCRTFASSMDDLSRDIQTNRDLQTVIYVHGNFTDYDWSLQRGMLVYKNAIACATNRKAVRFVIWSWSSERATVPIRDFAVKTDRSVVEGQRLASFIGQIGLQEGTSIGYSMGAQSVLTNFQILSQQVAPAGNWQVLLVAPSISPDFHPNHCDGDLQNCISSLTILTNPSDRALKNAKRLNRLRHEPSAIDQFNLASNLPISCDKISIIDMGNETGPKHSISRYSASTAFQYSLAKILSASNGEATPVQPAPQLPVDADLP